MKTLPTNQQATSEAPPTKVPGGQQDFAFMAINPWFAGGILTVALGMAIFFIPKHDELVQRLVEDGQHVRAMELAVQGESLPALVAVADADGNRGAEAGKETTQMHLQRLLSHAGAGTEAEIITQITKLADPKAAFLLVRQYADKYDQEHREKLFAAVAGSALALKDPRFASVVYAEVGKFGEYSESILHQAVRALQWSEQSPQALALLEKWEASKPLPDDLVDTKIALLRAVNQPAKALDAMLTNLTTEATGQEILVALDVAANASATAKLIPIVEHYLGKAPEHLASCKDLATGKVKMDAEWGAVALKFAQGCEWSGHPQEAFNVYMKLASVGNRLALDRLLALNPGLNRTGDLLEVLRHIVPVAEKPELEYQAAKILADSGEYDEAAVAYQKFIAKNPKDVNAWLELAAVYEEQSDLERAIATYHKVQELEPKNLKSRKEIAELQVARGEFRSAFQIYESLDVAEHDPHTLENYALLAESLAEYAARTKALEIRLSRLTKPVSLDYDDLARSYVVIGELEKAIQCLQTGMERIPESRMLRLGLAEIYQKAERYEQAQALLQRSELRDDMQAMMLYIDVSCMREDYIGAFAFLERGIENRFAFGPETRLLLSEIYFQNGFATEADALLQSVQDEPALWPLIASARFKRADYRNAERYQLQHVNALKFPDPHAWMFLGDIYKQQGKEEEARKVYAKALSMMENKISPQASSELKKAAKSPTETN